MPRFQTLRHKRVFNKTVLKHKSKWHWRRESSRTISKRESHDWTRTSIKISRILPSSSHSVTYPVWCSGSAWSAHTNECPVGPRPDSLHMHRLTLFIGMLFTSPVTGSAAERTSSISGLPSTIPSPSRSACPEYCKWNTLLGTSRVNAQVHSIIRVYSKPGMNINLGESPIRTTARVKNFVPSIVWKTMDLSA